MGRLVAAVPERPLKFFSRVRDDNGADSLLAEEFIACVLDSRRQLPLVPSGRWRRFAPILLRHHNWQRLAAGKREARVLETLAIGASGGEELVCYAVFQEIDRADRTWCEIYGNQLLPTQYFVEFQVRDSSLMKQFERFTIGHVSAAKLERHHARQKSAAARTRAQERLHRHRAKKSAK